MLVRALSSGLEESWAGIGPWKGSSMVLNACHAGSHLSCAMSSQFTTAGVASPGAGEWGGLWWPFKSLYKPE